MNTRGMSGLYCAVLLCTLASPILAVQNWNDEASITVKKVNGWDERGKPHYTPNPDPQQKLDSALDADKYDVIIAKPAEGTTITYRRADAFQDPVDDGALFFYVASPGGAPDYPTLPAGAILVRVERRAAIGAIYWVEVKPSLTGGGGGASTQPWCGVEVDTANAVGALVMKCTNSGQGEYDLTDPDADTPELYCARAEDGKGDVEFWLNTDSDTYTWTIKQGTTTVATGPLNSNNKWTAPKQADLPVAWYTLEVTKYGDQNFKRRIDFGVVQTTFFKNNVNWTQQWQLSDTPDLFTSETIVGIEITGVKPGSTVQAKMWTSCDAGNVVPQALSESSSGIYRNTDTSVWPRCYWEFSTVAKRLKVVDEKDSLCVVPLIDSVPQPHLETRGKLDVAEVAVVDGTATNDALNFWTEMTKSGTGDPCWLGVEKKIYSVSTDRSAITDDNIVAYGKKADILYVSGHGTWRWPGVSGAENEEDHPLGPLESGTGANFTPSDIGSNWDDAECEWVVLANCSQLHMGSLETGGGVEGTLGTPVATNNAVQWAKAMPNVHGIMGFRYGAPGAPTDEQCATLFATNTKTQNFHTAWLMAWREKDNTTTAYSPWNCAALVQVECLADEWHTPTYFPSPMTAETRYVFYWYERDIGKVGYGTLQEHWFTLP